MKLSKTQIAVLTALDAPGAHLASITGGSVWLHTPLQYPDSRVLPATLHKLHDGKYIEQYDYKYPTRRYRITDAGRAAIAGTLSEAAI